LKVHEEEEEKKGGRSMRMDGWRLEDGSRAGRKLGRMLLIISKGVLTITKQVRT
jgi:hypothetical protein